MAVVSFISTALIGRELAGQAAVEDVGGEETRLATQVQ